MKQSQLTLKFPQGRIHDVTVTFTDAACLVVHPTVHWDIDKSEPHTLENDWTISQYPTGYKIFDGIPSQEAAILCANRFLASKLFVAMSVSEFYNDYRAANLTKDEIDEGIKALVGAKAYIDTLKSR